jgi:hypothetical protein
MPVVELSKSIVFRRNFHQIDVLEHTVQAQAHR